MTLSASSALERCDNFRGVAFHLHLGENLEDPSVRPDDVRGAHDAHFLHPVHGLFLPNPVGFEHGVRRVPGEREIERIFVVKFLEIVNGVTAHPEDDRSKMVQFFFGVTELVRLAGSAGGISFGKEIEDKCFPTKITEGDFFSRVGGQRKIRRLVSNI